MISLSDKRIARAEEVKNEMVRSFELSLPRTMYIEKQTTHPGGRYFDIKWVGTDQVIGTLELDRTGNSYYNHTPNVYRLTSPRIPSRSQWRDEGTRNYKSADSAAKAAEKFCYPESNFEQELVEVEKRMELILDRMKGHNGGAKVPRQGRSWVEGPSSGSCANVIRMMATDGCMADGMRMQAELVKKQRDNDRYHRRLQAIRDVYWEKKWALEAEIKLTKEK